MHDEGGYHAQTEQLGPSNSLESLLSRKTAAPLLGVRYVTIEAQAIAPPGTLQKTRSEIEPGTWRGRAGRGRAGQAFEFVESGVVDSATANSSPRNATGHEQVDQSAETKPPAGSCSRILDQSLGSTRAC